MSELIGRTLGGRYRLEAELGSGGMARVYRARDLLLEREVAVKALRPELAAEGAARRRVLEEARRAAGLSHPNIVATYDVAVEGDEAVCCYIVQELVLGDTLKARLASGPLPPVEAVGYVLQLLDALAAAHRAGIVHRDIKASNVLLTPDNRVKVADFGIAAPPGAAGLDAAGLVLGTAQYAAPEQLMGWEASPASDLYSAGVVLYELLTGRLPFTGDDPQAVARLQVERDPPLPRSLNPHLPAVLQGIVLRALAKRPEERFASAEAMADALRSWLDTLTDRTTRLAPVVEPAREPEAPSAPAPMPPPVASVEADPAADRRPARLPALAIALLSLLALGLLGALALVLVSDPADFRAGVGWLRANAPVGGRPPGTPPTPSTPPAPPAPVVAAATGTAVAGPPAAPTSTIPAAVPPVPTPTPAPPTPTAPPPTATLPPPTATRPVPTSRPATPAPPTPTAPPPTAALVATGVPTAEPPPSLAQAEPNRGPNAGPEPGAGPTPLPPAGATPPVQPLPAEPHSVPTAAAPASGPAETIRLHYQYIDQRRYQEGYQLMSARLRSLYSLNTYRGWFRDKVGIVPVSIAVVSQTPTQAIVDAVVDTTDRVGGQPVRRQVAERFTLVLEGGLWRIDQVATGG